MDLRSSFPHLFKRKAGVRFEFPLDWSDRFYTRDTSDGFDFIYKAMEPNVEETMLAKILVMSPVQYEVYQYHEEYDQRFYKSLKASGDSKDKELQDEYNKIIKERNRRNSPSSKIRTNVCNDVRIR